MIADTINNHLFLFSHHMPLFSRHAAPPIIFFLLPPLCKNSCAFLQVHQKVSNPSSTKGIKGYEYSTQVELYKAKKNCMNPESQSLNNDTNSSEPSAG